MTKSRKTETVEYEDAIRDIYDTVQQAGSTRAEQVEALDSIADLCTDAIPDLDQTDEIDEDGD